LKKGKQGGFRNDNNQVTDKFPTLKLRLVPANPLRAHREIGKVSILELHKQKILGDRPRIF